jgi:multiple sugar transport system ATP-binding protein
MNFAPSTLRNSGGKLKLKLEGGLILPVPQEMPLNGKKREVILGLRPQHITRASSTTVRSGHARLPTSIELVQPTGSRVYITFPLGKTSAMAELDPHDLPRPGDKIELDLDMNRAVLIDPETQQVI